MNGRTLIPLTGLLLAAALASAAAADLNQRKADTAWKEGDTCAKQAFQKYPDYTPEGNAKRESARKACLRNHRLPVTGGDASSTPAGSSEQ